MKLFLINKPDDNPLPSHDDPCKLADDFGVLRFYRKIELIKSDVDGIVSNPPEVDRGLEEEVACVAWRFFVEPGARAACPNLLAVFLPSPAFIT